MINKHYNFNDDSWYDNPGCSCCEPILMEAYNCDEPELSGLGTSHSLSSIAYNLAYANELISENDYYFLELTDEEISNILRINNITYSILQN